MIQNLVFVLSIAALVLAGISFYLVIALRHYITTLSELVMFKGIRSIVSTRKYRRIKRYVLLKVVCFEDVDASILEKSLVENLYKVLGPAVKVRCGIAMVAFRKDLNRAIIRVSGDSKCVDFLLLALTIRHLIDKIPCLTLPIRTSGLLTRLRKYLRVYR